LKSKFPILIILVILSIMVLGCISNVQNLKQKWSKIHSLEALAIYKIGNKTYTSKILFIKPNKVLKEDINGKNITNAIVIINNTEYIVNNGEKFTLNATKDDISAVDPFITILDNINIFRFVRSRNNLTLIPKNPELPEYIVKLNGDLPKKITVIQQNQTLAVVNYVKMKLNINKNINASIVDYITSTQLKPAQKYTITVNGTTVFFYYSPLCPHCEAIMPFMKNLTREYKSVKFDFCNVYNCSGECRQVMKKYNVMFVPTVVVFEKNNTTVIVGSRDIKNKLKVILNET